MNIKVAACVMACLHYNNNLSKNQDKILNMTGHIFKI